LCSYECCKSNFGYRCGGSPSPGRAITRAVTRRRSTAVAPSCGEDGGRGRDATVDRAGWGAGWVRV
jgi:hypothetical protein